MVIIDAPLVKKIGEDLVKEIGNIEVGIVNGEFYRAPIYKSKKNFAKGFARKTSTKATNQTTAQILEKLDKKYKVLSEPLNLQNKNYDNMIKSILAYKLDDKNAVTRLKNAIKGLFLQPILIGKYGINSPMTAKIKGFNRLLIDTGQTIKAIGVRLGKDIIKDDK